MTDFNENDEHQVLNREEFKDLFADEQLARIVANDLYTHGWAICEIRRTPDGKIVGLDPIDARTIVSIEFGRSGAKYEQRIAGRATWIDGDKLMVIRLDQLI